MDRTQQIEGIRQQLESLDKSQVIEVTLKMLKDLNAMWEIVQAERSSRT